MYSSFICIGILLVSVLAVFWYQNRYWYRTFPSNGMNVRTSIGISIRVSVEHLLRSNHCKTFDMIKKTLKTSTGLVLDYGHIQIRVVQLDVLTQIGSWIRGNEYIT